MERTIKPRCPYFGSCGGCQLQHLAYEDQLAQKHSQIKDCLAREGLAEVEVKPVLGMYDPWFYRNKMQFPIRSQNNRLQMGYFKQKTHEVVNIKECYIQDPFLTEIAQIARKIFEERKLSAYDEKTGKGLLRHFIGRSGLRTNEMLLGIVVNGKGLPAGFTVADDIKRQERLMIRLAQRHEDYPELKKKPHIVGIVQNENTGRGNQILGHHNTKLLGSSFMRERLGKYNFHIHLPSFFQVNPVQAEKIYDLAKEFADLAGGEAVVDAYAGIGTIAFWLAKKAGSIIGIEEREEAVKDANENIKLNSMANITMKAGQIEQVFPKVADVVILDPPRAGCSAKALESVVKSGARKVVYVSCNPETLARDLKVLSAHYQIEVIQPVDMFPQTVHVEAVAKLRRKFV